MRCSFRSTTALAAALALMAPAALLAETPLTAEAAATMDASSRADMPRRAAQLDEELSGGLSPEMLTCLGEAPRPCPDGEALVTPEGLAVHLSQEGGIVLAPRNEQRTARRDTGEPAGDAPQAAADDSPARPDAEARAAARAERAETRAERQAARAAPATEAAAAPDADSLAAALAAASGDQAAGGGDPAVLAQADPSAPAAIPEPAPQPATADAEPIVSEPAPESPDPIPPAAPESPPEPVRSEPIPPATPEAPAEPAVAEPIPPAEPQDVAEPAPEPQTGPEAVAPAGEPQQAPAEPSVVEGGEAASAQEADGVDADGLAAALAAAADAEAGGQQTTAATGQETAPTPVEVDETVAAPLEETLRRAAEARGSTPAEPQQPTEPQTGAATGGDATAADAAAADAAAATAPAADALSAPATLSDNATAVVVTEESARAASEDFATRLTDGLTREQQLRFQQLQEQLAAQGGARSGDAGSEASDDGDDMRDLAGMLLAGAGGFALANILANDGQIALSAPDRVVVQQPDGTQTIIKDDNALLFQPGAQVTTEEFADGSSRTIVARDDGSRVVTIRDANLRVLRRTLIGADGTVTELIDDAAPVDPVVVADLPAPVQAVDLSGQVNEDALRAALAQEAAVDRRFTLRQIRTIPEVRGLVAPIEIDAITFDTGSAAIRPDQAEQLATLGKVISDYVRANPGEVFLIEGHTDTVGAAAMNLALSDRRAESVALALTQYFRVPPENMVVQGYGEQYLKVNQEGDLRANRRASVRRITDLLARN